MAGFIPSKKEAVDFNSGVQYVNGDMVQAETMNNLVESALYSQQTAENALNGITAQFDQNALKAIYRVSSVYVQYPYTPTPAAMMAGTSWEVMDGWAGRTAVGSGGSYTLGATGGSETHTLTAAEIPALGLKSDSGAGIMGSGASSDPTSPNTGFYPSGNFQYGKRVGTIRVDGAGGSHSIMQPYIVVTYWRRTA